MQSTYQTWLPNSTARQRVLRVALDQKVEGSNPCTPATTFESEMRSKESQVGPLSALYQSEEAAFQAEVDDVRRVSYVDQR